jgi:beta-lactamase regulating signal transducer with metallopeptidase domain/HEAT repeat protein
MNSNFLAALSAPTGSNIPMAMLLAKATIILLLALGMTVVMQRASAGARHLVWLVAVAALLFVPALTAWGPLPVRVLPALALVADQSSSVVGSGSQTHTVAADNTGPAAPTAGKAVTPSDNGVSTAISDSGLKTGISILFLIWAAVVVVIAASLGYAALAVRRIVNRARTLDSADWLNPLWEVSDRLALDEPPRLLRSEDAKMPFACGLFTPTIVLPAECDSWSLDRRRAVLLHELAHVRRHDLIGHTLGRLACAVYWFHPLVWTAAKRLRSESERACDDLALVCGARAADYAEHLLDIVTSVRRDSTPSVALAMARRKEFEGRMLAILDPELRHSSPSRRQSATLIGSLALISIVVGAAAPAPRASSDTSPNVPVRESESSPIMKEKDHSDSYQIINGAGTHAGAQTATSQAEHRSMSTLVVTETDNAQPSAQANPRADVHSVSTRAELLEVLRQGGAKSASKDSDERPALLAKVLSTDSDPNLRRIAAWGLAEYAHIQVAADALSNALRHDTNATVREMAAWALADANRSGIAVDALAAALHGDGNTRVRVISAWALGNVGGRSVADALAAALSDENVEIRKRAAWALGNADLKQAPPALIALLRDPDSDMRELVAWTLYQIEDPAAIPALETALRAEKNNKNLQIAYIKALAATGEKSVEALKGLLESKDPEIKSIAVRALAGGNATGPWPWPWPEPRPFPE